MKATEVEVEAFKVTVEVPCNGNPGTTDHHKTKNTEVDISTCEVTVKLLNVFLKLPKDQ